MKNECNPAPSVFLQVESRTTRTMWWFCQRTRRERARIGSWSCYNNPNCHIHHLEISTHLNTADQTVSRETSPLPCATMLWFPIFSEQPIHVWLYKGSMGRPEVDLSPQIHYDTSISTSFPHFTTSSIYYCYFYSSCSDSNQTLGRS